MKDSRKQRICPICGKTYRDAPSLSRSDNKTLICPDCGTREALSSISMPVSEQNKVISAIKDHICEYRDKK